ncbi:MAG: helix-turn-helix domain-containing protein [Desulfomonile tiedjei]|nr:helix-turn-helix domain-containing protein [Desulfomonile tiedjei]
MKKEARIQAEKLYLKQGGKVTNREIAKAVKVNALTVGRWKRDDDWETKLKDMEQKPVKEVVAVTVRKKAARDKALKQYLDAGGNITNKDLARKVGVSPATISKWKEQDGWLTQIVAPVEAPEPEPEVKERETPDLDIGELASPEQILEINRRIDELLKRDYLTSGELADVAEAKSDLLEAVQTYLAIVREVGEMSSGS